MFISVTEATAGHEVIVKLSAIQTIAPMPGNRTCLSLSGGNDVEAAEDVVEIVDRIREARREPNPQKFIASSVHPRSVVARWFQRRNKEIEAARLVIAADANTNTPDQENSHD